MSRTKTFHDLRDAMALPGCPVCRLVHRAADKYMDMLLWEMVNDPEARQDIRQAQGFCSAHAWRMVRAGPSLGATIIVHDVLRHTVRAIEASVPERGPRSLASRVLGCLRPPDTATRSNDELAKRTAPLSECPACGQARMALDMAISTLLEHLEGDDGLPTHFLASDGLCLPHLQAAADRSRDGAVQGNLLKAQAAIWSRLVDQLAECIRKCDYRFADEERGAETGACVRAVAALVGSRADENDRETSAVVFPFRGRTRGTV